MTLNSTGYITGRILCPDTESSYAGQQCIPGKVNCLHKKRN